MAEHASDHNKQTQIIEHIVEFVKRNGDKNPSDVLLAQRADVPAGAFRGPGRTVATAMTIAAEGQERYLQNIRNLVGRVPEEFMYILTVSPEKFDAMTPDQKIMWGLEVDSLVDMAARGYWELNTQGGKGVTIHPVIRDRGKPDAPYFTAPKAFLQAALDGRAHLVMDSSPKGKQDKGWILQIPRIDFVKKTLTSLQ